MILIKNVDIHTMTKEVIQNGMVLISDGKIMEVGKKLNIPKNGDIEIIDGKGGFLMPGMIDAHCHVGMFENGIGFEGSDGNEATDPITPQLRAIDGINPMDKCFDEALMGGVTTVSTGPGSANVIGGQFTIMKTYGKNIDDMVLKSCSAMKIAFGENPKRVYSNRKSIPTTRMGTASLLRENLMKAKIYAEKQRKSIEGDEKAPEFNMKMDALSKVIKNEIPLKAHAHRADDILTAIRIAKEFNVQISLEHCTEGHLIADDLKKEDLKGIVIGPTLTDRSKFELQNLTFKTPVILNNAGIKVALMTDHPVIPLQYLPICAALAAKEGMDEEEALRSITINPAKILEIDHMVGSIDKNKDADIIIYNGHPFDLRNKINFVMINGHIVKNQL